MQTRLNQLYHRHVLHFVGLYKSRLSRQNMRIDVTPIVIEKPPLFSRLGRLFLSLA